MKKPLLSISLLTYGRDDTLWKCLDSLYPILDAIPSELIVVDTGCSEEVHNRIKNYTDHIVKFSWCDDFSAARNAGLKECKGEWFMFLDDDEWFDDAKELIWFFSSGMYKAFGTAIYRARNYTRKDGFEYNDTWVGRLSRLDKGLHFKSRIHEYLSYVKGNNCMLEQTFVHHYGYAYASKDDRLKHSARNIPLLIKMIEDEPNEIHHRTHLAQEYITIKEYGNLLDVCEKGIIAFQDIDEWLVNKSRGTLYSGEVLALQAMDDYSKALESAEKYLNDEKNTDLNKAYLYYLSALSCYELMDYDKCLTYCDIYYDYYDKYHNDAVAIFNQASFFVESVFSNNRYANINCFETVCRLNHKDIKLAKNFFDRLKLHEKHIDIYVSFIKNIALNLTDLDPVQELVDMVSIIMNRPGLDQWFLQAINSLKEEGIETDKLENIVQKADSDHPFVQITKLKYADKNNDNNKVKGALKVLFSKSDNPYEFDEYVFEMAEKYNIGIDSIVKDNPLIEKLDLNSKNPILSISLLSSGNKDTLDKCLSSLTTLRKKVPSELIIIDTGCNAKYKAINQRYTDKIIQFTWIDDFAAARNAGVDASKGRYFMFIDDDEWFEDTKDIEEFFTTGLYKKYESALYIARNYSNKEGTAYTDDYVSRMFSLEKGIRFKSRIHEYPDPLIGKQLLLASYVHHFGYVFDSSKERNESAHFERNTSLLKEMIEEEPTNVRHWAHLAVEYKRANRFDDLKKTCLSGIKACEEIDNREVNRLKGTLYVGYLQAFIGEGDLEGAYKARSISLDAKITDYCRARLDALDAHVLYNLKDYRECLKSCEKYFLADKTLSKNKNVDFSQGSFFIYDTFSYDVASGIYLFYVVSLLMNRQIDKAWECFEILDFSRPNLIIPSDGAENIIRGICHNEFNDKSILMMQAMLQRSGIDVMVIEAVKKILKEGNYIKELTIIIKSLPQDTPKLDILEDILNQLEFFILGEALKGKVKELIRLGQFNEAGQIISQLMNMIPDDNELLELKQMV